MKYFKIREFECRCGCCMPWKVKENVKALVERVLDPARERLGMPVVVNSGYRCEIRNMTVGGAVGSQHVLGEAADVRVEAGNDGFTDSRRDGNLELARIILERGNFDQMILEECDTAGRPMWVHVSWKRNGVNRREVLRKMEGCDELERIYSL